MMCTNRYSNREVAQQLLDRGLSWCEGVVFLDDDDKQQVRLQLIIAYCCFILFNNYQYF